MSTTQRTTKTLGALAGAALLTACVSTGAPIGGHQQQPYQQTYQQPYQQPYQTTQGGYVQPNGYVQQGAYAQYGRVSNVEYLRGQQSDGVAGAVIGGAVGGLAGSQVGGGRGRTAATVAGVVGGALIGRALEQNMNSQQAQDYYRVTVQFDNGGSRYFDYAQAPNVRVGDRVRAEGNQLYR